MAARILTALLVLSLLIPITALAGNGNGPGGPPDERECLVLELVAEALDIDLDEFVEAYESAKEAADEYAATTTDRPINKDAYIFNILAEQFDLTVEEIEEAFEQARDEVFGD